MKQCGTTTTEQLWKDRPRDQISGYGMSAGLAAARNLFHVTLANAVCHDTENSDCALHHTTQGLITVDPNVLAEMVDGVLQSHLSIYF